MIDDRVIGQPQFLDTWSNRLIIGTRGPNKLSVYQDESLSIGHHLPLNGRPIVVETDAHFAYVATMLPSTIEVIDLLQLSTVTIHRLPTRISEVPALESIIDGQLPLEIASIAQIGRTLWINARDNNAGVLYALNLDTGMFSVPEYFNDTLAFDSRGWQLSAVGNELFATSTNTTPGSIYRLTPGKYREYTGHDYDLVSDMTAVWSSPSGLLAFIANGNTVIGAVVTNDGITPLSNFGTLQGIDTRNWFYVAPALSGETQFLAVAQQSFPSEILIRSSLFRLDSAGTTVLANIEGMRIRHLVAFKGRLFYLATNDHGASHLACISQSL